jgi:hypothetical protein
MTVNLQSSEVPLFINKKDNLKRNFWVLFNQNEILIEIGGKTIQLRCTSSFKALARKKLQKCNLVNIWEIPFKSSGMWRCFGLQVYLSAPNKEANI